MKFTSGPVADVGVPHGDGCRTARVPADMMPRRVIADPGEIATLPLAMALLHAEGNLVLVIAGAPLLEGILFFCRVVLRELGSRFTGCVSVVQLKVSEKIVFFLSTYHPHGPSPTVYPPRSIPHGPSHTVHPHGPSPMVHPPRSIPTVVVRHCTPLYAVVRRLYVDCTPLYAIVRHCTPLYVDCTPLYAIVRHCTSMIKGAPRPPHTPPTPHMRKYHPPFPIKS